jgi:hypothetical protein
MSSHAPGPEAAAPVHDVEIAPEAPEAPISGGGRSIRRAGAGALADDPRLGLSPDNVLQLSAGAGNATVARLLAPGRMLQRDKPPAPADKHALNPKDTTRLDNAKRLIDLAKVAKDSALKALSAYSAEAPGLLTGLKANADKNLEMYKAAANQANYIISEAKEIAKIQDEVLMQIIGAALGGLGTALEPISEHAAQSYEGLKTAYGELSDFGLGTLADKSGASGGAKGAMGMGTGDSPGGAVEDPSVQELAFYKSFSELHAKSTQLLGVSVEVAKISEPIGKVTEAIAGMRDAGKTRSDYPVEKVDKDAATLESASRKLAAAAPGITKILAELKSVSTQATVSAPKDAMEVEKALWKAWAAGLSVKDSDVLDLDKIENYLKKIGIWAELGIDRGDWFSTDEERLAIAAASAQQMVLQHRGEAVEFTRGRFGFSTIRLDGIPGAPDLPATLDPSSKVFTNKVRAVVIDARTIGTLEPELVEKTAGTKATVAEYLLKTGAIQVILRSYEDLSGETAPDEAPPP